MSGRLRRAIPKPRPPTTISTASFRRSRAIPAPDADSSSTYTEWYRHDTCASTLMVNLSPALQRHRPNTTELGYNLYNTQIVDIVEGNNSYGSESDREVSSVYRLITEHNLDLKEFLVGNDSLGAYLEEAGYSAVPAPTVLPFEGNAIFSLVKIVQGPPGEFTRLTHTLHNSP
jgi:hypothetical protein